MIDYAWDFFIAHAGPDKKIAEELYDLLSVNAKVFLDSRTLKLGDDWDTELYRAQKNSLISVILVSSSTDEAYYQREEISSAVHMARKDPDSHRVVPIYIDDIEEPPYGLRIKHGLKLTTSFNIIDAATKLSELLVLLSKDNLSSGVIKNKKDIDNLNNKFSNKTVRSKREITAVSISGVVILAGILISILIYRAYTKESRLQNDAFFLPIINIANSSIEYTFNSEDDYWDFEWILAEKLEEAMAGITSQDIENDFKDMGIDTEDDSGTYGYAIPAYSILTAYQISEIPCIKLLAISNFGVEKALNVQIDYDTLEIINYLIPQFEAHTGKEPNILYIRNDNTIFYEMNDEIVNYHFSTGWSQWFLKTMYQYNFNYIEADATQKYYIENEIIAIIVRHMIYAHYFSYQGISFEFPITISYNDIKNNHYTKEIFVVISAKFKYSLTVIKGELSTDYTYPSKVIITTNYRN